MAGKKRKKTLRTVHVNAGAGYDILIEPGILSYAGEHAARVCPKASKAAVVCDRNVFFPTRNPWRATCGTRAFPANKCCWNRAKNTRT